MVNKFLIWRIVTRALAITGGAVRHPFLASLPPHVCRMGEVQVISRKTPAVDGNWIRDFLMAYCACFAAIAVFFA